MMYHSRAAVLVVAAAALLSFATIAAAAPDGSANRFGHQVAECAQLAGFDGDPNPGRHRGFHGVPAEHHSMMP